VRRKIASVVEIEVGPEDGDFKAKVLWVDPETLEIEAIFDPEKTEEWKTFRKLIHKYGFGPRREKPTRSNELTLLRTSPSITIRKALEAWGGKIIAPYPHAAYILEDGKVVASEPTLAISEFIVRGKEHWKKFLRFGEGWRELRKNDKIVMDWLELEQPTLVAQNPTANGEYIAFQRCLLWNEMAIYDKKNMELVTIEEDYTGVFTRKYFQDPKTYRLPVRLPEGTPIQRIMAARITTEMPPSDETMAWLILRKAEWDKHDERYRVLMESYYLEALLTKHPTTFVGIIHPCVQRTWGIVFAYDWKKKEFTSWNPVLDEEGWPLMITEHAKRDVSNDLGIPPDRLEGDTIYMTYDPERDHTVVGVRVKLLGETPKGDEYHSAVYWLDTLSGRIIHRETHRGRISLLHHSNGLTFYKIVYRVDPTKYEFDSTIFFYEGTKLYATIPNRSTIRSAWEPGKEFSWGSENMAVSPDRKYLCYCTHAECKGGWFKPAIVMISIKEGEVATKKIYEGLQKKKTAWFADGHGVWMP